MDAFAIFGLQTTATLVTYALVARWYVWPHLARLARPDALVPLLLVHTLRTLGLVLIVPAVTDPDIPRSFSQGINSSRVRSPSLVPMTSMPFSRYISAHSGASGPPAMTNLTPLSFAIFAIRKTLSRVMMFA